MQPQGDDQRPHVVLVAAEAEYNSATTLEEFARTCLEKEYRCTLLKATGPEGSGRDDVPGLAALYDADVLVLSMRRRSLPVVQMDHLERFIRAGKPLVVLRTSVVAFQTKQDPQPGYVVWDRFDQEVLGCNYQGYNPKSRETGCDVWLAPEAVGHPILQEVDTKFHSRAWIYRQRPLADTTRVLLWGRWSTEDPEEPIAWTNTYAGARVFYTTLGHPSDFENEPFRRMLVQAIHWVVQRDNQTPMTIEATGDPRPQGIWDCPPRMKVVYQFKDPDWQLIWEQPGDVRGEGGFGMVFHGEQDTLAVSRDGTRIAAAERVRNFEVPAGGVAVYRMAKHADYNMNHKEDWLQAIREHKQPCMDIEIAHRVANLCNLGNLSYILGRKFTWDGTTEQFVGDEEASQKLSRPQRSAVPDVVPVSASVSSYSSTSAWRSE